MTIGRARSMLAIEFPLRLENNHAQRRHPVVVHPDRFVRRLCRDRHPHDAGIHRHEMGLRPGTHEAYVAAPWRQALGSTMHCVAGDGVGILVGAVIAALLALPPLADFLLEYVLG